MDDRTSRETLPGQYAALTGMVPQLTTPSRDHGELVDLWFGVQWSQRGDAWERSFARIVADRRPDPLTPSFFGLFTHAPTDGLIVARRIRRDAAAWRQAEEEARSLVMAVNADVAVNRPRPASSSGPTARRRRWSLRVRDVSAFFASLRWLGEQKRHFPAVPELPVQISGSTTGGAH